MRLLIMGSTGSIGKQALDVVRSHPDELELVGLVAGSDEAALAQQVSEFKPSFSGLAKGAADDFAEKVIEETQPDIVLNAIVGAAGLTATMATIKAGAVLALANKESLVAGGEAVMARASGGQIRPVDSEHASLSRLLQGKSPDAVRKVFLTASGGPFRETPADHLPNVTLEDALKHPVWNMGRKITVDSATLMNKGLEVIEAHFLFGLTYDEIHVVIHPGSLVHALVQGTDGSLFAHAAIPDMKLPIAASLLGESVWAASDKVMEPSSLNGIEFLEPDTSRFPALALAYDAGRRGDTYPAVLNAANELSVEAFLNRRLKFTQICLVSETVMNAHAPTEATIEGVLEADAWARAEAAAKIERIAS